MHKARLNPPTSTRSYSSQERLNATEYFDLERSLIMLEPTSQEWGTIVKATVACTAYYTTMRGTRSPFPSPVDFIDEYFGYKLEEEPVWEDRTKRDRSTSMLRIVFKLRDDVKSQTKKVLVVKCPICGKETISVGLGRGLKWNPESLTIDTKKYRSMTSISIGCSCKYFTTEDYKLFEKAALAKE